MEFLHPVEFLENCFVHFRRRPLRFALRQRRVQVFLSELFGTDLNRLHLALTALVTTVVPEEGARQRLRLVPG